MKNANEKMNRWDVEDLIEIEIEEVSKNEHLSSDDIADIRLDLFLRNGWTYDPKAEEEEEDDCIYRHGVRDYYAELGMSRSDFF